MELYTIRASQALATGKLNPGATYVEAENDGRSQGDFPMGVLSVNRVLMWSVACAGCLVLGGIPAGAQEGTAALKAALHFHAPFDESADAVKSAADRRVFSAESVARKQVQPGIQDANVAIVAGEGKYGGALRFSAKSKQVFFYSGEAMHYREKDWDGTVSFWMRLNPDKDLQPGYCDPIQITQRAWNNASFFVDFDKDVPRDFRLGVFSDFAFWNPTNIDWEKLPVEKRPMVTVKKPPFSRESWTHVAFTFEKVNGGDNVPATATLYLNGESRGSVTGPMQFRWELSKSAIMIGIEYVGDLDDLAIFRRALTPSELKQLYQLPRGVTGL